jgi:outer membrane immunogenic protein
MKERAMRSVVCLVLLCAMASPALPADLDVLRGSEPVIAPVGPATFTRWSGFYAGGDFSFNYGQADFSGATQPLVAYSLRSTTLEEQVQPSAIPVLGKGTNSAFGGGGFVGYNTQWQDLIIGFEANYTHTNVNVTAPSSPVARVFPAVTDAVAISGTGRLNLTDYAEARARAGYVVGNLLPYGFIGMAVGRASYSVTSEADVAQATNPSSPDYSCLNGVSTATCSFVPFSNSIGQSNALLYGFAVGGGLDWALTPNIFVRGEFEYIEFAPIAGINLYIADVRAGAGFKF